MARALPTVVLKIKVPCYEQQLTTLFHISLHPYFPHPHTPITTSTTITLMQSCSQVSGLGMGRQELFTPTLGAWQQIVGGVAANQYLRFPICKLPVNRRLIARQKKDVWPLQLYQASLAPQDLPCAGAGRDHAHLRA